ncbi:MAG: hypothetical protein WGN25_18925 [Candidatus Electrothrix sp. GW3-4]
MKTEQPKIVAGAHNAVKLRFIGEAELQEQGFPSWSLGTRTNVDKKDIA